ncbi:hypothetical protein [Nonomuraea sp. NPDC050786]|uniref:hypothetical protein n=1 Tax=Nonomuraea sp. NPDC050786 TaxID=3154840 RepID=UPI003404CF13
MAANVCGDQVRLALLEARPAGLAARQLVGAPKLSLYQVRKGILYIREVSAMAHLTPADLDAERRLPLLLPT